MPKPNEITPGLDGNASEPTPANKELTAQLAQLTATVGELQKGSEPMQAALQDPDVQRLIQLKAEGKEVTVGQKTNTPDPLAELLNSPDPEPQDKPEPFEGFTPAKIIEHIGSNIGAIVEKAVGDRLGPLQEKLTEVEKAREQDIQAAGTAELRADVTKMSKDYPDFGEYKDAMVGIFDQVQSGQGLSVKQYYSLAKVEKLGLPSEAPMTEHPFNFSVPTSETPMTEKSRSGRQGFQKMLDEATMKYKT